MNDVVTTTAEAPATGKAKSINDYSGRRIFAPSQHADALKYLGEIASCADYDQDKVVSNLGEEGLTAGTVVIVNPYNEREENSEGVKEQKTVGFMVVQAPAMDAFMDSVPGSNFVLEQFYGRVSQTWLGITRKAIASNEPYDLPNSVDDYVSVTQRSRSGPDMTAYNKYWKQFADWFKARKIIVKKDTLQLYLSNAAEATRGAEKAEALSNEQAPNGLFVAILDMMIAKCQADRVDPAILVHWKETRDKQEAEVIEMDFDLDDLGDLG